MKHIKTLFVMAFVVCVCAINAQAQIQSPSEYLGYEVGAKFSRHYQIMEYAKYVAEHSDRAVYEKIGHTYQDRELGHIVISTPENIKNIEAIRHNNLRITGMEEGDVDPTLSKAIVWLSYNVHGNEASCSEAALLAMYALANPNNSETQEWLENTVVIIDPALNPDGRDRYVNWYKSQKGAFVNASSVAREHGGQWPSGRTNHYYFDLNRDWAWQSQIESQARAEAYQKWMPHVHADYHEMGYNSPYYFAPAAEPFHLAITDWQKEFQTTIGKNHINHFEENNWLYFTRQIFDLFYPSYGDTWPTFNGAIGMTYEQGGIGAGLAIVTMMGDTLKLENRVAHHYTTSLSTVEISSKNADKLVKEFANYFEQPEDGFTYVVSKDNQTETVNMLLEYLDAQHIEYGQASRSYKGNGYDYSTGKQTKVEVKEGDIVINSNQPKATLARVLFEPNPVLTDSVTYDITAWQAHYVYGLKGYALGNVLSYDVATKGKKLSLPKAQTLSEKDTYAFVVEWNDLGDGAYLSDLLNAGIKVKYASKAFKMAGKSYNPGTLIITKANNKNTADFYAKFTAISKKHQQYYHSLESGYGDDALDLGSDDMMYLEAPKVLVLASENISQYSLGEVWHYLDQVVKMPATIVNADNLGRINLNNYNTLILPEGSYKSILDGRIKRLKEWIYGGGKLMVIGSANRFFVGSSDFSLSSKEEVTEKNVPENLSYDAYAERERKSISDQVTGAIYKLKTDNSHPLMYGMQAPYFTLKLSTLAVEPNDDLWNVGMIGEDGPRSGFVGYNAKSKIKNTLSFGVEDMGRGKVIYFIDNPLYREFWKNGQFLFTNGLFF